jgi:hypothetical protein
MGNTLITEPNAKTEATLMAGFALKGFTVHRAQDGYLVSRWGLTRHYPDIATLAAFAKQVGVPL